LRVQLDERLDRGDEPRNGLAEPVAAVGCSVVVLG